MLYCGDWALVAMKGGFAPLATPKTLAANAPAEQLRFSTLNHCYAVKFSFILRFIWGMVTAQSHSFSTVMSNHD